MDGFQQNGKSALGHTALQHGLQRYGIAGGFPKQNPQSRGRGVRTLGQGVLPIARAKTGHHSGGGGLSRFSTKLLQSFYVRNSQQIIGGGEPLGQSITCSVCHKPQCLGVGRRRTRALTAEGGVYVAKDRICYRVGGVGQEAFVPALTAEGERGHPQMGQDAYPRGGKMLGTGRRPGKGKLQHQISSAGKSHQPSQVGVGHGCLSPLDKSPAHEADHTAVVSYLLPHTGQKVGVTVMEGIEFTDHTRCAHGEAPFFQIWVYR